MADGDGPRSDAIRAAVSALSLEKGFECAEKNTIEILSETLKSCKCTSSTGAVGNSGIRRSQWVKNFELQTDWTAWLMHHVLYGYHTVAHRDA